ncbi:MAG: methyltransferase domain-containing protein [Alphaproteobacteria bacterium]
MLTVDVDRLGLRPGSRLLDVGCGAGRHVRATRRLRGVTGVGVDLGREEVSATSRSLHELDALPEEAGGTVDGAAPWLVARASGYELPFASESFDCVIVSEVLEHLHDDARALREVSRVLKPGGVLAVSVPRTWPEAVCWALSKRYRNTPGGHLRIYRRSEIASLVRRAGYRITGSHFAHALHAPFWWLKCAVGVDDENSPLVRAYHRFLVWDLMERPRITRWLETALNPIVGKSLVLYAVKE